MLGFQHQAIPNPEEDDPTIVATVHPSGTPAGGPATV